MDKINLIYRRSINVLGSQHWWPARGPFEVMLGAILTQNTSWSNVEKAIRNLKKAKLLSPGKIHRLSEKSLAGFIRPAGYYNVKARRIKNFMAFFIGTYQGSVRKMSGKKTGLLRRELLGVNGIGPETADSILLYALNKPVFVVDAYTKRIFFRHGLVKKDASYQQVQGMFACSLRKSARLFNEYHALLVKIGKDFCLKNKPKCSFCPLKSL